MAACAETPSQDGLEQDIWIRSWPVHSHAVWPRAVYQGFLPRFPQREEEGGGSTSPLPLRARQGLGRRWQPAPALGGWGAGRERPGLRALTDHLSLCPGCQAALDFVVEEDLRAHLTCWYIQKYVKENPLPQYLERLQP